MFYTNLYYNDRNFNFLNKDYNKLIEELNKFVEDKTGEFYFYIYKIKEVPKELEEFYDKEINGKKYFVKHIESLRLSGKNINLYDYYEDKLYEVIEEIFNTEFDNFSDFKGKRIFNKNKVIEAINLLKEIKEKSNEIERSLNEI